MRKATVPAISDADCRLPYGEENIVDSMLCAGYISGGQDSCQVTSTVLARLFSLVLTLIMFFFFERVIPVGNSCYLTELLLELFLGDTAAADQTILVITWRLNVSFALFYICALQVCTPR